MGHGGHVDAVGHQNAEDRVACQLTGDADRDRTDARDLADLAVLGMSPQERCMIDPDVDHGAWRALDVVGAVFAGLVTASSSPGPGGKPSVAAALTSRRSSAAARCGPIDPIASRWAGCRPSGSAGQTHEGIGGQGPGGLIDPGPAGIGGQEFFLRLHRPEQACAGVGGELGVEPNGPIVVDPVAEIAGTMDGPVGRALVLPCGLGPTATQLEHVERLLDGCLDELPLGLGQEGGRASDLLDLHLGEPPLADRLLRSREADELTGGLQGVDGRADPGSADLGDMRGRRAMALRAPDVRGLDASGGQQLSAGGQLLEIGEGIEQLRGIGAGETIWVEVGQHGAQLVGETLEGGEHHEPSVPPGCITVG